MGPPSPDTGAGPGAERGTAHGVTSERAGTKGAGKAPMSARPVPREAAAGTTSAGRGGAGCPAAGAGPAGRAMDGPPRAAATDCACPGTGETASPSEKPDPGGGEAIPTAARGYLAEMPQCGHRIVSESESNRGGSGPRDCPLSPSTGKAHREGGSPPVPLAVRGGAEEGGPPAPPSPQMPAGHPPPGSGPAGQEPNPPRGNRHRPPRRSCPPALPLGVGERVLRHTENQTPPPPHLRQKGSLGNPESYNEETPAKRHSTSASAPSAISHPPNNGQGEQP
ncbi:basic salivary proline-rich protein 2-like [Serinus canaria]|uniref:basic salivary proline-rich protein 2-like n=1 Tax=Serinus canaria TaxID=9135 RepID=UPI0021CC7888|nr:basic salivary proline-rich protein 2-like [Serinus canaria]